ncbi:MAG: type I glyceraldehyde-3-phosphate dehydrogenase [Candidatus Yanofskybacteria bacterium RIFCSPHIGHO2_01_FULL_39_8b]|uniref:Type I glyceraldehyde-3-phosphate dehydrogenase n=1 Tax=Candidatus Yanofskybacteria bacterium RIFCSPHIGHO2_01_FULL_39_8b TaxID=1802659 RepID=A0A1F8E973_9BACT|nr:MAG: type I glyceraldehyde-3-phosphate dehydrogenase [Candidatus Yanofskybacteria bacterium RIFCSPHIGHO2_01_FULL_39_8b]
MQRTKIAINGFGRIGRAFFKLALTRKELEILAINDLGDIENLAYLLQYDSAYGRYNKEVKVESGKLKVDGREMLFIQEKDPTMLPWKALDIDIVVEATGIYDSFEKAEVHKKAGAKRVVITAPAKDDDSEDYKTVLMGVNDDDLKTCSISSNGSCTTNSVSPVMQILSEKLGIKKAFLSTTHGYTATQNLIDGPVKGHDFRRGRSAAANISPSWTGAAIATTRAVKSLAGKFDGASMRVPIVTGSLSCLVMLTEKPTTAEEINDIFKEAEKEDRWRGILRTTNDQIVSSDIVGDPYAAIIDLNLTRVVDGDLCAVFSWYDNEFGYTNTLVQHVIKVAQLL